MKTLRPCLRCARDNPADAETCEACSAPLAAWASKPDGRPVRTAQLSSLWRRLLMGGLALVVGLLAVFALPGRSPQGEAEAPGASWRRPESIAAWASERFARRGSPTERALALVETRSSGPRRLLLTSHAPGLEVRPLVRAAAEVLLAARDGGERLLIHAALLEHGPSGERRSLLVPLTEAALVLTDETALAALLSTEQPAGLSALVGLPLAEQRGSVGALALEPAAEASQPDDEAEDLVAQGEDLVAQGEAPLVAQGEAPLVAAEPDPAAGVSPATPAVHVGFGLAEPPAMSPAGSVPVRAGAGAALAPDSAGAATLPSGVTGQAAAKSPPVSLLQGAGKRLAQSYEAGQQQVVLARLWVNPKGKRPLILRSLTVKPHGSLNDVEGVDFVYLVNDRDGNGLRDAADEQLGDVIAFVDDDEPSVFENLEFSFGADGQPAKLLLMVDFMEGTEGGTIMLTIPGPDGILIEEVSTGGPVAVEGLPFKGAMTTLNGDLEPDPFQAELDLLAEEAE